MKPVIVDLAGFEASKKEETLDMMDRIGFIGYKTKPGTEQSYIFVGENTKIPDLAQLLKVDASRITDASGWDMTIWLRS